MSSLSPPQVECQLRRHARSFGLPQFSTLSLIVVWTLDFVVALTAGALADVFQSNAPAFPLVPTASLAVGMNGLCGLFSIFLGYNLFDSYTVYQPFAGGERYVLLQSSGWMLLVSGSVFMIVYFTQLQPPAFRYGALTLLEGFASLGNVLLLASLHYFVPFETRKNYPASMQHTSSSSAAATTTRGDVKKESVLAWMLESPNSESGLVTIFLLSQLFLCYIGTAFKSISSSVMAVFTFFHVVNGVLIHSVIRWRYSQGYRLLQGPVEALCCLISCFVYFLALVAGIALIRTGTEAPPVAFGMTALAAFIGILPMLVLFRTAWAKENRTPVQSALAKYARFLLSAMAIALVSIPIGIMYYVKMNYEHHMRSANGRALIEGLLFCQTLSALFLLILTPVTHLIGRVIYGESFDFFQPFRGSTGFIVLQGLGWAFFAASVLWMTFHMTATDFRWILFASATGVMAQFFIQFSMGVYESVSPVGGNKSNNTSDAAGRVKSSNEDENNTNEMKNEEKTVLSGELILSLLLQLASLILRLVVDISLAQKENTSTMPRNVLVNFSALAFVVSVPLAHYSGTSKGLSFFNPFQGSGTYIALQSLGWAIYALFVLRIIIDSVLIHAHMGFVYSPLEHPPFLWFTLEGCLQTVPYLLIVLSVIMEVYFSESQEGNRLMLLEALDVVKTALEDNFDSRAADEQAKLQMSMRVIAVSSLSAYNMKCDKHRFRLREESKKDIKEEKEEGEENNSKNNKNNNNNNNNNDSLCLLLPEPEICRGPATVLVMLLCFSSATCYIIAALWASRVPVVGFTFTVSGLAICTISCVSAHCGYGVLLHGHTGEYTFFMPFKGGSVFVALQIAGWVSYSCTFIFTLIHIMEDVGQHVELIAGAVFSVVSQICILRSIPKFNSHTKSQTYLEENGEGVVAFLVFTGAFLFGHLYLHAQELFRGVDEITSTDDGYIITAENATTTTATTTTRLSSKQSNVPFFIIALSIMAAVPFVLITLNRSVKRLVSVVQSPPRDIDADDEEPWERRRSLITNAILRFIEIMMLVLGIATPTLFMFLVYYIIHAQYSGLMRIIEYWLPLGLTVGSIALLTSLLSHIMDDGIVNQFIACRQCVITCTIYSLPILCAIVIFGPSLLLPFHSPGSHCIFGFSLVMAVGGPSKQLCLLLRLGMYAMLGYATYWEYLRVLDNYPSLLSMICTLKYYIVDVVAFCIVFWYLPLYDGKPEETGSQRRLGFIKWAQRHLFKDIGRYFHYRLILEDESVSMREGRNQYMFVFHPHGVFAGSALTATLSDAWIEKIGYNSQTYVATHEASILFNVPIVRDFNLSLGALAVTRSAIRASLSRGNSAVIVAGGQAEMILSKRSDKVMSLVTCHHGFVRLALEQKVPLVPLICFAEQNVLDILQMPKLHRVTLKLLGFPFPIVPHGRWLLPLPYKTQLTVVVGAPLRIPPNASASNAKDVEKLAEMYFSSVRELFYKHRAAAGYPEMELAFYGKNGKKLS